MYSNLITKSIIMKKITFIIFCLFFTIGISAQDLTYETKVVEEYSQQYQKKSIISDISGVCDVVSTVTAQDVSIGWNSCEGNVYEGTVEFVLATENLYNVFTTDENGTIFNDQSFGAFYACYATNSQGSMPNSDANFPTLYFEVTELGEITFSGTSQWGEVYAISDVVMDGAMLDFKWTNDYGEGATVELVRQDGQLWEELLAPTVLCSVCSETDSLALVALYNSTNGSEWNIPWDLASPVRDWYGVTLNDACCVAEINMAFSSELSAMGANHNNLVGELPAEMNNLASLEILNLDRNMISGDALSTIMDLSELREIRMFFTQVSGEIPVEIGNLQKLEIFSLSQNELTGEIPAEFGSLPSLRILSCSGNQLEGELPSELSNIATLQILFASTNNITGEVPVEYGNFQSLRQLSAWGNEISGSIPQELTNVTTLENLTLAYNQLTGTIPINWNTLVILRLSHNQLEGEIPVGLTNMLELRLDNNNLTGEIPEDLSIEFGEAPLVLNLASNNLFGPIRSSLIRDGGGQDFYLSDNDFESCVENMENLCIEMFNDQLDTVEINGNFYLGYNGDGYNLSNNPKLPWEGNLQKACNGTEQIGAPCDDGNPDTDNDGIDEDCNCSENSVATQEVSQIESLAISPNPVSSGEKMIVSLQLNQSVTMKAQLIDITGKVVSVQLLNATEGKNEFILDSQLVKRGLYFLQLSSEDGVSTKKVVIQ